MAHRQVFDLNDEGGVFGGRRIVLGPRGTDAPDQRPTDLVFAWSSQYVRPTLDAAQTGVVRMVVGDGDDVGSRRQWWVAPAVTVVWIRQNGDITAAQAETGVTEPGEIHA